jgi:hypothetical protein
MGLLCENETEFIFFLFDIDDIPVRLMLEDELFKIEKGLFVETFYHL